jgi:hypothetical protein
MMLFFLATHPILETQFWPTPHGLL